MAYLFIAHDLAVVKHISHRIAVMYLGQIVELAPSNQLFQNPAHPYTKALLAAIPVPDPDHSRTRTILKGEVGNTASNFQGCCFASRCPLAADACHVQEPPLVEIEKGHYAKCFCSGQETGARRQKLWVGL
jgi:oligopeptide/dipeptide ABC transporter ATP-binding protein